MTLNTAIAADARLYILRELAEQIDGRLYDKHLQRVLDARAIGRPLDWVRTQLSAMKDLDAIRVIKSDDVWIAQLLPAGQDHLDRRIVLEGIARPTGGEG